MANSARISAITNIMSEGGVSTKPLRRYGMFVVLFVAQSGRRDRKVPAGNVQRSTKVAGTARYFARRFGEDVNPTSWQPVLKMAWSDIHHGLDAPVSIARCRIAGSTAEATNDAG